MPSDLSVERLGTLGTSRRLARSRRRRRVTFAGIVTQGATGLGVIFFTLFAGIPIVYMLSGSLKSLGEIYAGTPNIIPLAPTLDNYRYVLFSALLQSSYPSNVVNSLTVAATTIVLVMAVSLPASLVVARQRFWLTTVMSTWARVAQIVGGIVVIIPLYLILRELHLTNNLLGVSLAQAIPGTAFSVWILTSFIKQIPSELDDAAYIDGANRWQVLWYIILPLSRTGIASVVLIVFLISWNDFLDPVILIRSPDLYTTMSGVFSYVGLEGQVDWGKLLSISLLNSLVPLLVIIIAERHIVRGLMAAAFKG